MGTSCCLMFVNFHLLLKFLFMGGVVGLGVDLSLGLGKPATVVFFLKRGSVGLLF